MSSLSSSTSLIVGLFPPRAFPTSPLQISPADAYIEGDMQPSLAMQRGIPLGKPPVIELRNQHAQYAATWCVYLSSTLALFTARSVTDGPPRFSLSAATSVMLVLLFRRPRGGPKAKQLR